MEPVTSSKAISKKQIHCLEALGKSDIAKKFYMAGGTALAILLSHRISVDLDFFSPVKFSNDNLIKQLSKIFNPEPVVTSTSEGTLYVICNKVNISFIHYPYNLVDKKIRSEVNINLAGLKDIAAMKLSAVTGRTVRKDFIDIYFLLKEEFTFNNLISFYIKKFGSDIYNEVILTKSLMAINMYDDKNNPEMLKPFNWNEARNYILKEAANYFKSHAS